MARFERTARTARAGVRGVVVLADVTVLARLTPDWGQLGRRLGSFNAWVERLGADQVAATIAGVALWLCAVWLAIALLAAAASTAPGRLGAFGRWVIELLVPATARQLVIGAVGLSVTLAGPAAANAAAPSWPTSPPAPVVSSTPIARAPIAPTPTASGPTASGPSTPGPTTAPAGPGPKTYVVVPGDCLWNLAAAELSGGSETEIATRTGQWYAANRPVIGPNPALLRPGERLTEPTTPTTSIHSPAGTIP